MSKIEIRPLWHRGKNQIGIYFKYDDAISSQLRNIKCEFSYSNKCWYLENTEANKRKLLPVIVSYGYKISTEDQIALRLEVNLRADLPDHMVTEYEELKRYLKVSRYGNRTIDVYMNMAILFLGYFRHTNLNNITEYDIERFNYEVIVKRKYSSSYQRQMIGVLKLLFRGKASTLIDWDKISRARKDSRLPVVLSLEEVVKIITVIENIKHRAIISLMYASGLRISEVIDLRISDIDSMRLQIRVKQAKGKKDRYVALSQNVLILLRNYFQDYKPQVYLFNGAYGEKYSAESIRKIFKQACEKAGILKEVSPHTLRHSYATHLLENGVDLRYIQELLGHSRPETTMIYTHVTKNKLLSIKSPFDLLFTPPIHTNNSDINNPDFSTLKLLKGNDNTVKEPELTYF